MKFTFGVIQATARICVATSLAFVGACGVDANDDIANAGAATDTRGTRWDASPSSRSVTGVETWQLDGDGERFDLTGFAQARSIVHVRYERSPASTIIDADAPESWHFEAHAGSAPRDTGELPDSVRDAILASLHDLASDQPVPSTMSLQTGLRPSTKLLEGEPVCLLGRAPAGDALRHAAGTVGACYGHDNGGQPCSKKTTETCTYFASEGEVAKASPKSENKCESVYPKQGCGKLAGVWGDDSDPDYYLELANDIGFGFCSVAVQNPKNDVSLKSGAMIESPNEVSLANQPCSYKLNKDSLTLNCGNERTLRRRPEDHCGGRPSAPPTRELCAERLGPTRTAGVWACKDHKCETFFPSNVPAARKGESCGGLSSGVCAAGLVCGHPSPKGRPDFTAPEICLDAAEWKDATCW